jgi:pimeloyl-ACP methyl ester carboxylesterase
VPTFRSDDGIDIFYEGWGDGDDVPVVLQHGFGASAEVDWVQTGVVDALTAADRRVIALDARGHGRSDKPHDPARLGEARMAQDVITLIDLLGVPAVDLVGYSMGAVIALLTATRSRCLRRLIVGGIGAATVELGGVDTTVLDQNALRDALLTPDPSTIADPGAAAFRTLADTTGGDRLALAAQTMARHREKIPLASVSVPTLVLAGRDDPLARRPEILAAAIPGSRLKVIDGDHGGVLHEPAFRDAIVAFLAEG